MAELLLIQLIFCSFFKRVGQISKTYCSERYGLNCNEFWVHTTLHFGSEMLFCYEMKATQRQVVSKIKTKFLTF